MVVGNKCNFIDQLKLIEQNKRGTLWTFQVIYLSIRNPTGTIIFNSNPLGDQANRTFVNMFVNIRFDCCRPWIHSNTNVPTYCWSGIPTDRGQIFSGETDKKTAEESKNANARDIVVGTERPTGTRREKLNNNITTSDVANCSISEPNRTRGWKYSNRGKWNSYVFRYDSKKKKKTWLLITTHVNLFILRTDYLGRPTFK